MSGGKTLEELLKDHKDEEPKLSEDPSEKTETKEERERREARLAAIQNRIQNKQQYETAQPPLKVVKENPYKSSGGKNERLNESRARALLSKKQEIEDTINRNVEAERQKQEEIKKQEEELKMHRTDSQKKRADQIINRYGNADFKQDVVEEQGPTETIVDHAKSFQDCLKAELKKQFELINQDNTLQIITDSDEEDNKSEEPKDIVRFVFEEEGKCIYVHKHILTSKLALFRTMFKGGMVESQTNKVDVFDIQFRPYYAFIEYLYTGEIQSLDSNHLIELLELSDRFCVEKLRSLIEDKLIQNLGPDTVKDILEVAHYYKLSSLKIECWRYVKQNPRDIARFGVNKLLDPSDLEQIRSFE